jgi:DNA phosphorothioation-associated putative methyltransferase
MGDGSAVRSCIANVPVGKLVNNDLYVHRSSEDDLPALLRLVIFAAKQIVGEVDYNVIKIRDDGRALSFLQYQDFDISAHPVLCHSVRVYLPKATYDLRDYRDSANPPILHRKDTLVAQTYPLYNRFRALTESEEAASLLSIAGIGYRQTWEQVLTERGLELEDHALRPSSRNGQR